MSVFRRLLLAWRAAIGILGVAVLATAVVPGSGGLAVAFSTPDTRPIVADADSNDAQPVVHRIRDAGPPDATRVTVAPDATSSTTTSTTTTSTTTTTRPTVDLEDREAGWEQRRGAAALARIAFDPAAVGYEIRFLPARPGYYGMTYPNERRIDVWVRPDQSLELLTHVTAHELGHAVDLTWNDDARRQQYRELRGLGTTSWFTCDGCTDFSTPAGDFAEVFAHWAVGETDFRSTLAPPPPLQQLAEFERFFAPS